jgi:hypothetical protein
MLLFQFTITYYPQLFKEMLLRNRISAVAIYLCSPLLFKKEVWIRNCILGLYTLTKNKLRNFASTVPKSKTPRPGIEPQELLIAGLITLLTSNALGSYQMCGNADVYNL